MPEESSVVAKVCKLYNNRLRIGGNEVRQTHSTKAGALTHQKIKE